MTSDMILLQKGALLLGLELTEKQLVCFDLYQNELRHWNAKTNLISANTSNEIVTRHFLDSLTAARFIINPNARIVDIGCGAGFPGIPLKISLPSLQLYLLESNRKKVSFLKHIIRLLNLTNTFTLNDRTENILRTTDWQGKFDVVISRAALKLPDLMPISDYFLAPEGLLIALKGQDLDDELEACQSAQNQFKNTHIIQHDINLPRIGPPRKIIIIQKLK